MAGGLERVDERVDIRRGLVRRGAVIVGDLKGDETCPKEGMGISSTDQNMHDAWVNGKLKRGAESEIGDFPAGGGFCMCAPWRDLVLHRMAYNREREMERVLFTFL